MLRGLCQGAQGLVCVCVYSSSSSKSGTDPVVRHIDIPPHSHWRGSRRLAWPPCALPCPAGRRCQWPELPPQSSRSLHVPGPVPGLHILVPVLAWLSGAKKRRWTRFPLRTEAQRLHPHHSPLHCHHCPSPAGVMVMGGGQEQGSTGQTEALEKIWRAPNRFCPRQQVWETTTCLREE